MSVREDDFPHFALPKRPRTDVVLSDALKCLDPCVETLLLADKRFCDTFAAPPSHQLCNDNCCDAGCFLRLCRFTICKTRLILQDSLSTVIRKSDKSSVYRTFLSPFVSHIQSTGEVILNARLDETEICPLMVARIMGISLNKLLTIVKTIHLPDLPHGRTGMRYHSSNTHACIARGAAILENLVQEHPCGGFLVPPGLTKSYLLTKCDTTRKFKWTTFKQSMKQRFFFRKKDGHLRCTICSALNKGMLGKSRRAVNKQQLEAARTVHFQDVRTERQIVSNAEEISRTDPLRVLVLNHDGMSRDGTKLPSWFCRAKTVGDDKRLLCPLHGVQVSRTSESNTMFSNSIFLNPGALISGGTNYYIASILHTLSLVYVTQIDVVPPTLVLLQDNVAGNKSDVFYSFIGWLLLVFPTIKNIHLIYYMVGHTHSTVDGIFGVVKNKFGTRDVTTVEDVELILDEMLSVSEVSVSPRVWNFEPIKQFTKKIEGRNLQHQMVFFRDDNGDVKFKYAHFMRSSKFYAEEQSGADEWALFQPGKQGPATEFRPQSIPFDVAPFDQICKDFVAASEGFLSQEEHDLVLGTPNRVKDCYISSAELADVIMAIRNASMSPHMSSVLPLGSDEVLGKVLADLGVKPSRKWKPVKVCTTTRKPAKKTS